MSPSERREQKPKFLKLLDQTKSKYIKVFVGGRVYKLVKKYLIKDQF